MYIEKRKEGNSIKYYLIHSFRDKGSVSKIRKYLGSNLPKDALSKRVEQAKKEISGILDELNTQVFHFALNKNQIRRLNFYNQKVKIGHLDPKDWVHFTEEFTYNTNAIEGSTVKREDVATILKKRKPTDIEEIETKNVAAAVDFIKETKEELNLNLILKLHKMCFSGSKHFAGKLRNVEVIIRNSKGEIIHQGVPAKNVKSELNDMINWHKQNSKKFKPLIMAVIMHNQFEYIHPFQDGNGRVGRLLLNYILLRNNYPPINIILEDRMEYYEALQKYDIAHDVKSMLKFLIRQYSKTVKVATGKKK